MTVAEKGKGFVPFRKGQSGNPAGRSVSTCGAVLREAVNSLIYRKWPVRYLRRLRNDICRPVAWRAAAGRVLELTHFPDMADFQAVLTGAETLTEARARGVSTECIKKCKARTVKQRLPNGDIIEVTTVELELYNRAGEEFDRLCDRTEGKPKQTVQVDSNQLSAVMILTPMSQPTHPAPLPLPASAVTVLPEPNRTVPDGARAVTGTGQVKE